MKAFFQEQKYKKGEDIIERNNSNFMYAILSHCR